MHAHNHNRHLPPRARTARLCAARVTANIYKCCVHVHLFLLHTYLPGPNSRHANYDVPARRKSTRCKPLASLPPPFLTRPFDPTPPPPCSADSEGLGDAGAPKTTRSKRGANKKDRGRKDEEDEEEGGGGDGVNPPTNDDDEEVDHDEGEEEVEDEDEDGEEEAEEEEEGEEQVDPVASAAAVVAAAAKPADKRRRRKRPLKKAPGAPKRSKTAYIIFSMYKRPEIKAQVRWVD